MTFTENLEKVLDLEGTYSDHKSDSGGKTMYGITVALARQYGYRGKMQNLSLNKAKQIYYDAFWLPLNLDAIYKIMPTLVHELFDTGVNQGTGRAAEYLQYSLNAFNRQEKDYKDIRIDGSIGPATLSALKQYYKKRGTQGELVLLRALNCLQGSFYLRLSQARKKDEDFAYGWVLNRVVI
jgi:lysozyme family protein